MLLVFCVATAFFVAFLGFKKGLRWSAGLLLVEYFVLLIVLSVLARKEMSLRAFNFVPFWSYRAIREGHGHLLTQAVGNVGAFVPMGMLLGFLGRGKWWKVLLISAGFSVLIETLQFVSLRGFAEFDDVFHNVVGAMIGYGVYVGVRWLIKKVRRERVVGV